MLSRYATAADSGGRVPYEGIPVLSAFLIASDVGLGGGSSIALFQLRFPAPQRQDRDDQAVAKAKPEKP